MSLFGKPASTPAFAGAGFSGDMRHVNCHCSTRAAAAKRKGISVDQARAERVATVPARRIGDPAEFGATCAFLCSAHAGYITGQNIVIDGGAFPGAF